MKTLQLTNTPYTIYLKDSSNSVYNTDLGAYGETIKNVTTDTLPFIPYIATAVRNVNTINDAFTNNNVVTTTYVEKRAKIGSSITKINSTNTDGSVLSFTNLYNFTSSNIVVKDHNNIPKIIHPVVASSDIPSNLVGKFVIVTTYVLNNLFGNLDFTDNDYVERLYTRYRDSGSTINTQAATILKFCIENYRSLTTRDSAYNLYVAASCEVTIDELLSIEDRTLYLPNQNLVLSLQSLIQCHDHPSSISQSKDLEHKDNTLSFFIIDNDDLLATNKYCNIVNNVIRIPKLKDNKYSNGLYVYGMLNAKPYEHYTPIDQLDTVEFIYGSEEELLRSMDPSKDIAIQKATIELKKTELELDKADRSKESMNIEADLKERELRYKKLEFEFKSKQAELDFELSRKNRELESMKRDNEYFKYQLDNDKGERDLRRSNRKEEIDVMAFRREGILETVKTISVIATAGVIIYKLVGKNFNFI